MTHIMTRPSDAHIADYVNKCVAHIMGVSFRLVQYGDYQLYIVCISMGSTPDVFDRGYPPSKRGEFRRIVIQTDCKQLKGR
jgi:hypothetical protein